MGQIVMWKESELYPLLEINLKCMLIVVILYSKIELNKSRGKSYD